MKKYFVFIASFGLLYVAFQLVSGMILTSMYTPDFSNVGSGLSQEVAFGTHSSFPFLMAILVGTIAFFISNKFNEVSRNK